MMGLRGNDSGPDDDTVEEGRREAVVAWYIDAWNDPSTESRLVNLDACWDASGVYMDATVAVRGRRELAAHISDVQRERPGSRVEVVGRIRSYDDVILFRWRRVLSDGRTGRAGTDFCEVGGDGKLVRVVGFD